MLQNPRAEHTRHVSVFARAFKFGGCGCVGQGSHVFLKIGLLVAERLLYTPSAGVCMLCGWILANIAAANQHWKDTVKLLLGALVAACIWRCRLRNAQWADADTLYAAALVVCPESARINNNVGTRYGTGMRCTNRV